MADKRFRVTSLRLSDQERADLEQRASSAGMTCGQYLRHCALRAGPGAETPPPKLPAPAQRVAMARYKLDALGADPLRGGARSARR